MRLNKSDPPTMMQWMHSVSRSWPALVLMGALSLSFVVWGIADIFTGRTSTAVATVGSAEIDERTFVRNYRSFLRNASQRSGQEITPEMAQRLGLGPIALQQITARQALDNVTGDIGLITPDEAAAQYIQSMPQFRGATGRFDHESFLRAIQGVGYTEQDFIADVRADLTRQQFTGAVEGNFAVPAGYAQALLVYSDEKRAADYVIVSPQSLPPVAAPDDKVLAAFVKAHAASFSTPEYRDIDYAELAPEDLASQITVTDAQVHQEFEARKATYVQPEKRDVQQLPFPTEAEARAARAKLDAGTSFEFLIRQRGFQPADISSTVAQSELPADLAAPAFALKQDGVSAPLKSTFGFVLVHVTRIVPGSNKSFDDVKEDIRKSLATQLAAGKLVDIANAFADARSGGATIAQAAKKTGMKAGHVAAIDAGGKAPDGSPAAAPQDPEFLAQMAHAEEGEDNDPFPSKAGHYYVVKVNGVTPPRLKSLDQVRGEALSSWTAEQRMRLLATRASELAAQAVKENSLANVARTANAPVQHSPALARNTDDATFSAALVRKLFDAKAGGIVSGAQGVSGNFIIAKVTGIAHAPLTPAVPGFAGAAQQLSSDMASDFSLALADAARAKQGVKINQRLLESAMGQGS